MNEPQRPPPSLILRRFVGWFLERLYTDLAWGYDMVANITSVGQWWSWQRVIEPGLPPGRLLELGHGTGRLLKRQLDQGRRVIGLDRSSSMSRLAARRLRRSGLPAPVVRGDATALPFADHSFDGAYSTFPSSYIADSRTIRESLRVLKPGAQLLVVPMAWITGSGLADRLANLLFRLTGQSSTPEDKNWPPIESGIADVQADIIQQERADVLLLSLSAVPKEADRPRDG